MPWCACCPLKPTIGAHSCCCSRRQPRLSPLLAAVIAAAAALNAAAAIAAVPAFIETPACLDKHLHSLGTALYNRKLYINTPACLDKHLHNLRQVGVVVPQNAASTRGVSGQACEHCVGSDGQRACTSCCTGHPSCLLSVEASCRAGQGACRASRRLQLAGFRGLHPVPSQLRGRATASYATTAQRRAAPPCTEGRCIPPQREHSAARHPLTEGRCVG